eukprot:scaffold94326_cov36-Attheya_sp.AAC.1
MVGKIARMEETRLPIKIVSCWLPNPRPAHKPHSTNRNSLVRSLQIMDPNISKHGILNEWFPSAQNEEEWNQIIENMFINEKEPPRKRRKFENVTELEHHPETNQGVHLPIPRTEVNATQQNHDAGESNFPFPPESEFEQQTLDHTPSQSRLNVLVSLYLP